MTTENMSPDLSPNSVKPSGVRRVNNLPLIIAAFALVVFIAMIAFVAVKRANYTKSAETDVTENSKTNISTNSMAQEVLGDHVSGTFGDQLNDVEMLQQAYYSFAVGNAREEVKAAAKFQTDTNINNGVLKILKLLL